MEIVQKMWDNLWKIKIDNLSLLHRTSSVYLTYVKNNMEFLKKEFPDLFAITNIEKKIIQYVAWQTLGPQLIRGFNVLYSTHKNDYSSFTKKSFSETSFRVLSEEPEAWSNPLKYLEFDKQSVDLESKTDFKDMFPKIKEEIRDKNDLAVTYGYCLGIIMAKSPMGPPECYGSAANLIQDNIIKRSSFMKRFQLKDMPDNWEQQNDDLRRQFKI